MSVATLQRRHVVQMLDAKKDTPGASRSFLKCVRLIIQYAINIGIRQDDPTAGLRVRQPKTGGHPTWSEENIAAFRAAYPIGTKPRLAMELLLGTALRCADVVKLGRGHIRNGTLTMPVTQKTKVPLVIPVSAEMAEAINAAAPSEHVTFLINERGRSFGPKKFGEWFSEQCRRAGLNGVSAHGLRKGLLVGWRRPDARHRRSPPSPATRASPRCSAISPKPTVRGWLAMRRSSSGRWNEAATSDCLTSRWRRRTGPWRLASQNDRDVEACRDSVSSVSRRVEVREAATVDGYQLHPVTDGSRLRARQTDR